MTSNEIYERLTSVVRNELRQPALKISAKTVASDVAGWDSTAMVSVILAIEDEFGFEMLPNELRNVRGVADLAKIITRHLG